MIAPLLIAWWALLPNIDPGLPTPPPPLPTYVIDGNGERLDCTPNYQTCWTES